MLLAVCMYVVVLFLIQKPELAPPSRTVESALALVGAVSGAAVLYLRFGRIATLYHPIEPVESKPLARQLWALHIYCYVFSEVPALVGFALAFMGGERRFYIALFGAAVMLMLLCFPHRPAQDWARCE